MIKSSLMTLKILFLKQDLTVHLWLTLNLGSFGFHFLSVGTMASIISFCLFFYCFKNMSISLPAQVILARNHVLLIFVSPST